MRHTLAVLVENKYGVLTRVAGMFSRRGYNIDSLTVSVTEDPTVSRMTIVVMGDDEVLEQVTKQLNKLIEVIRVIDLKSEETVERELALIKVKSDVNNRSEIMQIADIFRARIIDVASAHTGTFAFLANENIVFMVVAGKFASMNISFVLSNRF